MLKRHLNLRKDAIIRTSLKEKKNTKNLKSSQAILIGLDKITAKSSEIAVKLNEIKKFYLFESKRWDILTKNNQIIKLPIKDYEISLQNFIDLKDQINFGKYQIFDYRINNQIILK